MKGKKRKYSILDTLILPIRYCTLICITTIVLSIVNGLMPSIQTLVVAEFINKALQVFAGKCDISSTIPWITLLALSIMSTWIIGILIDLLATRLEVDLKRTFRVKITDKRTRLKYWYVEDSDSWDLISRVAEKPEIQLKEAFINNVHLGALIFQILGLMIILFTQVWWSAILLLVFSFPMFYLSLKSGKLSYQVRFETQKYHRRYEYYTELLTTREPAQERVLFQYGQNACSTWHDFFEKARKIELKTRLSWFTRSKLGAILTICVSIFLMIILISPVSKGVITVGMFMSLINSTFSLVDVMAWSLPTYVEKIANNIEYMKELTKVMNLDEVPDSEEMDSDTKVDFHKIVLKDVCFQYPGTSSYILNHINLEIVNGKRYAIVGSNGAGKTTLVKVLTGLYDNYEGEILVDGKSLRDFSRTELSRLISSVYQDFCRYSLSIAENIEIGNVHEIGKDNENKIMRSLKLLGLDQAFISLKDGIHTKLGKVYENGLDLSGGQWQRVAMARTIFSDAPIYILDEPTAALDPMHESAIYKEFDVISKNKTSLFISHRLGSTKLADEIIVLDQGKIAEQGSHSQLMQLKGIYANMYESQRSWYVE